MALKARGPEGRDIGKGGREQLGYSPLIKVINWVSLIWVLLAAAASGWPSDAFAQRPEPHYQYAVKFVCGQSSPPDPTLIVVPGQYLTAINIHNPANEIVEYRFKTAQAQFASNDGPISPFIYATTGPDGAQVFVCRRIVANMPPGPLHDGFFVIESRLPLDVTAVYTAAPVNAGVSSIHVDKIAARRVPNLCQQDIDIDLSRPQHWAIPSLPGNAVQVTDPTPLSAWAPGRTWMSYAADGQPPGTLFPYRLDFCSCSPQGGTMFGTVQSDNASTGDFNRPPPNLPIPNSFTPLITGTGNFGLNASMGNVPVQITAFSNSIFAGGGSGSIIVRVQNDIGTYHGVSFFGTLHLVYGHLAPFIRRSEVVAS